MNDISTSKTSLDTNMMVNTEEVDGNSKDIIDDDPQSVSCIIVHSNAPLYKSTRVCTRNKETQTEVTRKCQSTDVKLTKLTTSEIETFMDGVELSPLTCLSMNGLVTLFAAEISKQITSTSQRKKVSFFTQLPSNVYMKRTILTYNDSTRPMTKSTFTKMTSDLYYRFDVAVEDTNSVKLDIPNSSPKTIVSGLVTQSPSKRHTPIMENMGDTLLTEVNRCEEITPEKDKQTVYYKRATLINNTVDTRHTNTVYKSNELKRKRSVEVIDSVENRTTKHTRSEETDVLPVNGDKHYQEKTPAGFSRTFGRTGGTSNKKISIDNHYWKRITDCETHGKVDAKVAAVQNTQKQHRIATHETTRHDIKLCEVHKVSSGLDLQNDKTCYPIQMSTEDQAKSQIESNESTWKKQNLINLESTPAKFCMEVDSCGSKINKELPLNLKNTQSKSHDKDTIDLTVDKLSEFLENFGQTVPVESTCLEIPTLDSNDSPLEEIDENVFEATVDNIEVTERSINSLQVNCKQSALSKENHETPSKIISNFPIDVVEKNKTRSGMSYKCKSCDNVYRIPQLAKCHIQTHSQQNECSKSTDKFDSATLFIKKKDAGYRKCPVCGIKMKQNDLVKHAQELHTKRPCYKCLHCQFSSCLKSALQNHKLRQHNIKSNYVNKADPKLRIPLQFSNVQVSEAMIRKLFRRARDSKNKQNKVINTKLTADNGAQQMTNADVLGSELGDEESCGKSDMSTDVPNSNNSVPDNTHEAFTEPNAIANVRMHQHPVDSTDVMTSNRDIAEITDHDKNTPNTFSCVMCPTSFQSEGHLHVHYIQTHSKCPFCIKVFRNEWYAENHCLRAHGFVRTCPVCGVQMQNTEMKRHASSTTHRGRSLDLCPHCPYVTIGGKIDLRRHISEHKDIIKCLHCFQTFNSYNMLQRHYKLHKIHPEKEDNELTDEFVHATSMQKKKMDARSRKCPVCNIVMKQCVLVKHFRKLHPKQRLYKCYRCEFTCCLKSDLFNHRETQHNVKVNYCRDGNDKKFRIPALFSDVQMSEAAIRKLFNPAIIIRKKASAKKLPPLDHTLTLSAPTDHVAQTMEETDVHVSFGENETGVDEILDSIYWSGMDAMML